jgi:hypothetical protein
MSFKPLTKYDCYYVLSYNNSIDRPSLSSKVLDIPPYVSGSTGQPQGPIGACKFVPGEGHQPDAFTFDPFAQLKEVIRVGLTQNAAGAVPILKGDLEGVRQWGMIAMEYSTEPGTDFEIIKGELVKLGDAIEKHLPESEAEPLIEELATIQGDIWLVREYVSIRDEIARQLKDGGTIPEEIYQVFEVDKADLVIRVTEAERATLLSALSSYVTNSPDGSQAAQNRVQALLQTLEGWESGGIRLVKSDVPLSTLFSDAAHAVAAANILADINPPATE